MSACLSRLFEVCPSSAVRVHRSHESLLTRVDVIAGLGDVSCSVPEEGSRNAEAAPAPCFSRVRRGGRSIFQVVLVSPGGGRRVPGEFTLTDFVPFFPPRRKWSDSCKGAFPGDSGETFWKPSRATADCFGGSHIP
jgi:hypothetical protein